MWDDDTSNKLALVVHETTPPEPPLIAPSEPDALLRSDSNSSSNCTTRSITNTSIESASVPPVESARVYAGSRGTTACSTVDYQIVNSYAFCCVAEPSKSIENLINPQSSMLASASSPSSSIIATGNDHTKSSTFTCNTEPLGVTMVEGSNVQKEDTRSVLHHKADIVQWDTRPTEESSPGLSSSTVSRMAWTMDKTVVLWKHARYVEIVEDQGGDEAMAIARQFRISSDVTVRNDVQVVRSVQMTPMALTQSSVATPSIRMLDGVEERFVNIDNDDDEQHFDDEDVRHDDRQPAAGTDEQMPISPMDTGNDAESAPSKDSGKMIPISNDCSSQRDNSAQWTLISAGDELSTDYLLSDAFTNCKWITETSSEGASSIIPRSQNEDQYPIQDRLATLARPALWKLSRTKLLTLHNIPMHQALQATTIERLQATVRQLFRQIKNISLNPSIASHDEVIDRCNAFRDAIWIHTLK